jgi:hypothetical protein
VKHAGAAALDQLAALLAEVRGRPGLVERRPGIFYRRGRAYLHFHEDPAGLFADLRDTTDWQRFRVSDPAEQTQLIAVLDASLQG